MQTFSQKFIGSKLLSPKKDLELLRLLTTKLSSIKKFRLLFRASEHNFNTRKFHKLCDNKGPTITIIQSDQGNIFGGYTSKSWMSSGQSLYYWDYQRDDKKCPLVFDIKEGRHVEYADIFVGKNKLCYTYRSSYEYKKFGQILCGYSARGEVIDYEVILVHQDR